MPISTQELSKICQPTDSEIFYKEALIKKLEQPDDSVSIIDEQNNDGTLPLPDRSTKKFNLSTYLSQLVYPAECTNECSESILNASIVVDHVSSAENAEANVSQCSQNHVLDNSMIDEELVMSLSQKYSPDETCKLN